MAGKTRPTGVAVLSILGVLGAILAFIAAVVLGVMSTVLSDLIQPMIEQYGGAVIPNVGEFLAAVAMAIAVVLAIIGIVTLLTSWGLWTGKSWARWLAIILMAIGIIGGIISLPAGIITIVICGLIMYYLFMPSVREFFGEVPPKPTP